MNQFLKSLYVAINDNEVVCFETNLKQFSEQFLKVEPMSRNYYWFFRKFEKNVRFCYTFNNREYWFQKLI